MSTNPPRFLHRPVSDRATRPASGAPSATTGGPSRFRFLHPLAPLLLPLLLVSGPLGPCAGGEILPGTTALTGDADLSERMAAGVSRYFERQTQSAPASRAAYWQPDFSSATAYSHSVAGNRERLRRILGVVEPRLPVGELEYVSTPSSPAKVAETDTFTAYAVRWPLFAGVHGEGLLLQPKITAIARIVAIPDADQTPETIAGIGSALPPERHYARRLAELGCQVLIPTLVDRSATYSGNAQLDRFTNQPHREWIYRQAYTFGRHVIGYELQKIAAAIDWLSAQDRGPSLPLGVAGWGEGGLLALYGAATDPRIAVTLVSGYFDKRERIWTEPIYRNVFGLLREFGDAEVASLIVPRSLIIEHARAPRIDGPPPPRTGAAPRLGASAAPGRIITPVFAEVVDEFARAQELAGPFRGALKLMYRDSGLLVGTESDRTIGPMADETLLAFLRGLRPGLPALAPVSTATAARGDAGFAAGRQRRQVEELEQHLQGWIERSRGVRDEFLLQRVPAASPAAWHAAMQPFREKFQDEIHGRLPPDHSPLHPQSRLLFDRPRWQGYEVTLNMGPPELFVWGYLLLPKDLQPGERRPVIVAQHGGTGLPFTVIDEDPARHQTYKAFAVQLVERGYVVFAPHFPWRTMDRFFRVAERKAHPLGQTTFAIIFAQHQRLLDWLTAQPWVDPQRIGFYGLSWGGKLALRVPAVETRYALSICSGDFNEWIWKCATTGWGNSYMYVPEYDTLNFNLGQTFGHAEMAALIAPRAFMVERGHGDGVGTDAWVAFEYARVERLYRQLQIPQQTEIEFFDGGHEIHAVKTFEFIQRVFGWRGPNP